MEFTDVQTKYLSNYVFSAVRKGWITWGPGSSSDAPFRVLGTGEYPAPPGQEPIPYRQFQRVLASPHPAIDLHSSCAILIDRSIHDSLEHEVPMRDWAAYLESLHSDRRVLWYIALDPERDARARPVEEYATAAIVLARITERLIQAGLVNSVET